jgi:hypothetical protein
VYIFASQHTSNFFFCLKNHCYTIERIKLLDRYVAKHCDLHAKTKFFVSIALQEVLHVKPQRAKLRFANKKQGFLLALQK